MSFRTLLCLLTVSVATVGAAAEPGPLSARFRGVVDVSPQGTLRVQHVDGVQGALATAVRSQIETLRAEPAVRGGITTGTSTAFHGEVLLTPRGEQYDIALERIWLLPAAITRAPVLYPVDALRDARAGWVEAEFGLDASGAPDALATPRATHPHFAKAVSKALASWRFATAGVEPGRRFRLLVTFRTDTLRAEAPSGCEADPTHARLATGDGCVDRVDVEGSRVRRGIYTF